MNISERIKSLRKDLGYTQIHVAQKIGIDQRQYSRYEAGASKPSIDSLIKIAEFYEVPIDIVIYGHNPRFERRANVNDKNLLELFYRMDRLHKVQRDKLKWAIEALLNQECQEQPKESARASEHSHKLAKSA